jgi:DNA-binding GntR family transcriptional regulator
MSEKSKKHDVYFALKQAIISGVITPGIIVNENDLAQRYSVSRTPVREALILLGQEGFVESLPRAGYMVTQLTIAEVQESFHLREVLEVEAARLAATSISVTELSGLEARKQGIPPELNPGYNREFHMIIAAHRANRRLARLVDQLLDEMERILIYDPQIAGPALPDEHQAIIDALNAHNASDAQEAMRSHIRAVKVRVLERF